MNIDNFIYKYGQTYIPLTLKNPNVSHVMGWRGYFLLKWEGNIFPVLKVTKHSNLYISVSSYWIHV
jgi:hypothetical protein